MKRSQLALSKAVESGDTDLGESLLASPTTCCQVDDVTLMMSLMVSCVTSLHGGELPKERDEPRRFLYDPEEPTSRPQPLQTGTHHYHHPPQPRRFVVCGLYSIPGLLLICGLFVCGLISLWMFNLCAVSSVNCRNRKL